METLAGLPVTESEPNACSRNTCGAQGPQLWAAVSVIALSSFMFGLAMTSLSLPLAGGYGNCVDVTRGFDCPTGSVLRDVEDLALHQVNPCLIAICLQYRDQWLKHPASFALTGACPHSAARRSLLRCTHNMVPTGEMRQAANTAKAELHLCYRIILNHTALPSAAAAGQVPPRHCHGL
jgi:hypothetical protein